VRGEGKQRVIPYNGNNRSLHNHVGQQFIGQPGDLLFVEFPLDQKPPGGMHAQIRGDSKLGGGGFNLSGGKIGLACGRMDINFPEHRGSSWLG
jgi:hypothetical protein